MVHEKHESRKAAWANELRGLERIPAAFSIRSNSRHSLAKSRLGRLHLPTNHTNQHESLQPFRFVPIRVIRRQIRSRLSPFSCLSCISWTFLFIVAAFVWFADVAQAASERVSHIQY